MLGVIDNYCTDLGILQGLYSNVKLKTIFKSCDELSMSHYMKPHIKNSDSLLGAKQDHAILIGVAGSGKTSFWYNLLFRYGSGEIFQDYILLPIDLTQAQENELAREDALQILVEKTLKSLSQDAIVTQILKALPGLIKSQKIIFALEGFEESIFKSKDLQGDVLFTTLSSYKTITTARPGTAIKLKKYLGAKEYFLESTAYSEEVIEDYINSLKATRRGGDELLHSIKSDQNPIKHLCSEMPLCLEMLSYIFDYAYSDNSQERQKIISNIILPDFPKANFYPHIYTIFDTYISCLFARTLEKKGASIKKIGKTLLLEDKFAESSELFSKIAFLMVALELEDFSLDLRDKQGDEPFCKLLINFRKIHNHDKDSSEPFDLLTERLYSTGLLKAIQCDQEELFEFGTKFTFIHKSFKHFFATKYLIHALLDVSENLVRDPSFPSKLLSTTEAKAVLEFFLEHRYDHKLLQALEFTSSAISAMKDSECRKVLSHHFVTLVSSNVDKVIETSSFDKISTFMHLIAQTKIAFDPFYRSGDGEEYGQKYAQFSKAKELVDEAVCHDIIKWQSEILSSGYISQNLIATVYKVLNRREEARSPEQTKEMRSAIKIFSHFIHIKHFADPGKNQSEKLEAIKTIAGFLDANTIENSIKIFVLEELPGLVKYFFSNSAIYPITRIIDLVINFLGHSDTEILNAVAKNSLINILVICKHKTFFDNAILKIWESLSPSPSYKEIEAKLAAFIHLLEVADLDKIDRHDLLSKTLYLLNKHTDVLRRLVIGEKLVTSLRTVEFEQCLQTFTMEVQNKQTEKDWLGDLDAVSTLMSRVIMVDEYNGECGSDDYDTFSGIDAIISFISRLFVHEVFPTIDLLSSVKSIVEHFKHHEFQDFDNHCPKEISLFKFLIFSHVVNSKATIEQLKDLLSANDVNVRIIAKRFLIARKIEDKESIIGILDQLDNTESIYDYHDIKLISKLFRDYIKVTNFVTQTLKLSLKDEDPEIRNFVFNFVRGIVQSHDPSMVSSNFTSLALVVRENGNIQDQDIIKKYLEERINNHDSVEIIEAVFLRIRILLIPMKLSSSPTNDYLEKSKHAIDLFLPLLSHQAVYSKYFIPLPLANDLVDTINRNTGLFNAHKLQEFFCEKNITDLEIQNFILRQFIDKISDPNISPEVRDFIITLLEYEENAVANFVIDKLNNFLQGPANVSRWNELTVETKYRLIRMMILKSKCLYLNQEQNKSAGEILEFLCLQMLKLLQLDDFDASTLERDLFYSQPHSKYIKSCVTKIYMKVLFDIRQKIEDLIPKHMETLCILCIKHGISSKFKKIFESGQEAVLVTIWDVLEEESIDVKISHNFFTSRILFTGLKAVRDASMGELFISAKERDFVLQPLTSVPYFERQSIGDKLFMPAAHDIQLYSLFDVKKDSQCGLRVESRNLVVVHLFNPDSVLIDKFLLLEHRTIFGNYFYYKITDHNITFEEKYPGDINTEFRKKIFSYHPAMSGHCAIFSFVREDFYGISPKMEAGKIKSYDAFVTAMKIKLQSIEGKSKLFQVATDTYSSGSLNLMRFEDTEESTRKVQYLKLEEKQLLDYRRGDLLEHVKHQILKILTSERGNDPQVTKLMEDFRLHKITAEKFAQRIIELEIRSVSLHESLMSLLKSTQPSDNSILDYPHLFELALKYCDLDVVLTLGQKLDSEIINGAIAGDNEILIAGLMSLDNNIIYE